MCGCVCVWGCVGGWVGGCVGVGVWVCVCVYVCACVCGWKWVWVGGGRPWHGTRPPAHRKPPLPPAPPAIVVEKDSECGREREGRESERGGVREMQRER